MRLAPKRPSFLPEWRALALFAVFCSAAACPAVADAAAPATSPATRPSDAPKFVRFSGNAAGGGTLETATVRYQNTAGVVVDLVAAVHVADPGYYTALDRSFVDYDRVLFEMVRSDPDAAGGVDLTMAFVGLSQRAMASILDLQGQKHGIDYARPNLLHADLDLDEFNRLQDLRGESLFGALRDAADSPAGRRMQLRFQSDVADALMNGRGRFGLKVAVARNLGSAESLGISADSVLIGERNKVALGRLADRLAAGDRTLAIFYGAAHLLAMEHVLMTDMTFRQVGPPFWRVAWDLSTPPPPATRPAMRPVTAPAVSP